MQTKNYHLLTIRVYYQSLLFRKGKNMDAGIVFKRVTDGNYGKIKQHFRLINVLLAIDGQKSIKTIANEYNYEMDHLISMVDQIEKMGLIVPVDGAKIENDGTLAKASFDKLPAEFHTGIEDLDKQHGRLVEMLTHLNKVRKAHDDGSTRKREMVGSVIAEMIDYSISHFAFEEALMEDAQYDFFHAHKRIHELFVNRAGEYKKRFDAGEDIVDELYDVLNRWLFNHIRNDDNAYAPCIKARLKALDRSKHGWLGSLFKRFFR
jgi:hemerythrin